MICCITPFLNTEAGWETFQRWCEVFLGGDMAIWPVSSYRLFTLEDSLFPRYIRGCYKLM